MQVSSTLFLVVVMVCIAGLDTVFATEEQDHYKVLGVEKTATLKQIKKAYKQLALKYHPDKVRDKSKKKAAEEKFFKINQAYETLSDPEKKKLYDMQKSGNPNPFTSGFGNHHGSHGGHPFNFDSMFFENVDSHQPFHFTQDFPGNFFSFDDFYPEDHHPFFEDHTFGDGSSFFGSHFGAGHHSNHHSQHSHPSQHNRHQRGHQRGHSAAHNQHFSQSNHQSCRMVTQRIGNMVTTLMQCS